MGYFAIPKQKGAFARLLGGGAIFVLVLLVYSELNTQAETFMQNYVGSSRYESQGAFVRSDERCGRGAFLLFYRRWKAIWQDADIWRVLSLVAIALIPMTFVASTAVDRIGLYLLPLQLVVFGRLPSLMRGMALQHATVAGVIFVYAVSFGVWQHLGQFAAGLWLPNSSLLFGQFS